MTNKVDARSDDFPVHRIILVATLKCAAYFFIFEIIRFKLRSAINCYDPVA